MNAPAGPSANRPESSDVRVRFAEIFDGETRAHDEVFGRRAAIRPGESVLDIGCGTGGSTRQAAADSVTGDVLGVDITPGSIEFARRAAAHASNVRFVVADAQTDDLGGDFDVAISRFGVMFFADPAAAFGNIARAVRPGGRLVLLVWQGRERNEWATALETVLGAPRPSTGGSDPYSLADPEVVRPLLRSAGFTDIGFEAVEQPVSYGSDLGVATEFVLSLREPQALIAAAPDPAAAREEVRRVVAEHHDPVRGVTFAAATWVVTAIRA